MIAIIDYGVGNIYSLYSSFRAIGEDVILTNDARQMADCEKIILPGVGAFGDAFRKLEQSELIPVIKREVQKGKPMLGICLGMQLLFQKSYEYGEHPGLGLIQGAVREIREVIPSDYKIPHIGWNALSFSENPIFRYIKQGDHVYFVHSYYGTQCDESVIATTEYGAQLTAAVARDNVFGVQFHPEKSGDVGLRILKAFCEQ